MEDNKSNSFDERIILNVGGVKYETYRSTLTAYPDTLLGTMFQPRNYGLLRPTNGNEYFFDRDGHVFRYIMQFYRTGELTWPGKDLHLLSQHSQIPTSSHIQHQLQSIIDVTHHELKRELDFFQIRANETDGYFRHSQNSHHDLAFEKAAAIRVNEFVTALKDALYEMIMNFRTKVGITFYWDKSSPVVNPKIESVTSIVQQFAYNGYHILQMFNREIEEHLQFIFKDLVVRVDRFNNDTPRAHINVYISLNRGLNQTVILNSSCLKSGHDSDTKYDDDPSETNHESKV